MDNKDVKKQENQLNKTNNGCRLLELVEKDVLVKILKSFYHATGLRANIVDTEGKAILHYDKIAGCSNFCKLIWQYQNGYDRCRGAYKRAGNQAAKFGEPYIFRCPAGLVEWATPIIIDGEHLGSIISGEVLMWEPEDFFWIELEEMNKNLGVDMELLKDAARELEVVSGEKVQAAADLLHVTSNYIMKAGWENLRHQKELFRHQALLAEEIKNRKDLEKKLNYQSFNRDELLEKERELVSKVKLGDKTSAQKLLQELLADIFIAGAAEIQIIKARVLELVVILSRAAVEGGADFNEIMNISNEFVQDISKFNELEEIHLGAIRVLQLYTETIEKNAQVKNHQIINKIKRFIMDNYQRNIGLEDIAKSVYLSTYYISHIFKEEQGLTLMEYITKVRLEEAKKLLRNPNYTVNDIASKVGYSDSSYFSKIFRRNEGMTPTQFRRQL